MLTPCIHKHLPSTSPRLSTRVFWGGSCTTSGGITHLRTVTIFSRWSGQVSRSEIRTWRTRLKMINKGIQIVQEEGNQAIVDVVCKGWLITGQGCDSCPAYSLMSVAPRSMCNGTFFRWVKAMGRATLLVLYVRYHPLIHYLLI